MKTLKQRQKRILGIALILAAMGLGGWLFARFGKPFWALVRDSQALRAWVDGHGWKSHVIYTIAVCLQVIFAPVPGGPLELAAGYAFGTLEGTLICLVGIFLGSVIIFALVRRFGRRFALLFFTEEQFDSLKFLHDKDKMLLLTTLLMVVPGTPKDMLTWFVGLTDIPWGAWLLICSLGRVPSVLGTVWGASSLAEGKYVHMAVIFAVTAALSAIGLIWYRALRRRKAAKQPVK